MKQELDTGRGMHDCRPDRWRVGSDSAFQAGHLDRPCQLFGWRLASGSCRDRRRLAVSATLWLELRKREAERHEEQRVIRDAMQMLQGSLLLSSRTSDCWCVHTHSPETCAITARSTPYYCKLERAVACRPILCRRRTHRSLDRASMTEDADQTSREIWRSVSIISLFSL